MVSKSIQHHTLVQARNFDTIIFFVYILIEIVVGLADKNIEKWRQTEHRFRNVDFRAALIYFTPSAIGHVSFLYCF